MDKQQLNAHLEQLHTDLNETEPTDETRDAHETLKRGIRDVLDNPEAESHHYDSLRERLNEALLRFEVSHPLLFASTQRALDALNEMGI